MSGGEGGSPDELRRRLYAPGATPEDVARYRTVAPAEPPPAPAAPPPPPRRARRALLLGAGGLLAIAAVAGAVLAGQAAAPRVVPTTARPEPSFVVQTALPIPADGRAGFVRALDAGGSAGVRRYLYDHPESRPDAIRTVNRLASSEYHGVGADTIRLEPSALAADRGRMTVLLVLDGPGAEKFEWRATRIAMTNDRSGPEETMTDRDGVLRPGEVGTATVAYARGAPASLLVLVGERVRWGAVVVFSD